MRHRQSLHTLHTLLIRLRYTVRLLPGQYTYSDELIRLCALGVALDAQEPLWVTTLLSSVVSKEVPIQDSRAPELLVCKL